MRTLADDSLKQILAMTGHRIAAIAEFKESGTVPGSAASYWPEEHAAQLAEIAKRTHEVNEMIEEQISLSDSLARNSFETFRNASSWSWCTQWPASSIVIDR